MIGWECHSATTWKVFSSGQFARVSETVCWGPGLWGCSLSVLINLWSHREISQQIPVSVEFHFSRNRQLIGLESVGKGRWSCCSLLDFTALKHRLCWVDADNRIRYRHGRSGLAHYHKGQILVHKSYNSTLNTKMSFTEKPLYLIFITLEKGYWTVELFHMFDGWAFIKNFEVSRCAWCYEGVNVSTLKLVCLSSQDSYISNAIMTGTWSKNRHRLHSMSKVFSRVSSCTQFIMSTFRKRRACRWHYYKHLLYCMHIAWLTCLEDISKGKTCQSCVSTCRTTINTKLVAIHLFGLGQEEGTTAAIGNIMDTPAENVICGEAWSFDGNTVFSRSPSCQLNSQLLGVCVAGYFFKLGSFDYLGLQRYCIQQLMYTMTD